jgi:hypothetical protein
VTDLEFRILAAVLKLRRFTSERLATESGINSNSVRSWLRRNPQRVTQQKAPPDGHPGRGRPRVVWHLRPEMESEMRTQLERAYPLDAAVPSFNLETAGYLRDLNVIEEYVDSWRAATKRHFADVADMNRTAAQSHITAAWLSFAELDASGHSVAQSAIEQLVVFETELGIAAPPTIHPLQDVANWTAKRLKQMMAAGASAPFAARVLCARASAQPLPWQTRLLLSSLAAPVWADEDVPEMSELSIEDAQRCILIADATPVNRRLDIVASALKDPAALAVEWTPDQRQAALLGLADRQYRNPLLDVRRWLWELSALRSCWTEDLSLPVWYGIGESELNSARVIRDLQTSVRNGIGITRSWSVKIGRLGKLRKLAIDWCERSLGQADRPEQLELSNIQSASAYFCGRAAA